MPHYLLTHSDFSGFWADAVIHHLVPPFRTEVLLLQLPRAVGSWQPIAEFPARTCTWLKGASSSWVTDFFQRQFVSSDWSMWGFKDLTSFLHFKTTLKDHVRFRTVPSTHFKHRPPKSAKASVATVSDFNCFLCPVLLSCFLTGFGPSVKFNKPLPPNSHLRAFPGPFFGS